MHIDSAAKPFAHRTVIVLEVLSHEPIVDLNLADIAYEITDGDCSGHYLLQTSTAIDQPTAHVLLEAQGSDPTFLDDYQGDEADLIHPTPPSPDARWSIATPVPDYGDECVILLGNGGQLRCPPYSSQNPDCHYVRVIDTAGVEVGYWNTDELREAPGEVLGAILGAAHQGVEIVRG